MKKNISIDHYKIAKNYLVKKGYDVKYHSVDTLSRWAENNLSDDEWRKLKIAIKVTKHRAKAKRKTITLHLEAWEKLRNGAKREGVTLSEYILLKC